MKRKDAENFIKSIIEIREDSPDKIASSAVDIYPSLHYNESVIKNGTRIKWQGRLMRAAVDLQDTELNNPDNAPTLWEELLYRDGVRIIPDVITVGTAFKKDEIGWYKGKVYKSKIDNNVHNPVDYPEGWDEVQKK